MRATSRNAVLQVKIPASPTFDGTHYKESLENQKPLIPSRQPKKVHSSACSLRACALPEPMP